MTIAVRSGGSTNVGLVRKVNQDDLLAEAPVFAVADGMGGHARGEVAAGVVISGLRRFEGASAVDAESVLSVIREANDEIQRLAAEDASYAGMGTTVTGIALTRRGTTDALLIFNVGDSRVYRLRHSAFEQLSKDHSLIAELVDAGELTEDEARRDKRRNVVTRAVGIDEVIAIDSWLVDPEAGDVYLACSDGLTAEVDDSQIRQALESGSEPNASADALVALALAAGGRDNISALVLAVDGVTSGPIPRDEDTNPRVAVPVLEDDDTEPIRQLGDRAPRAV